MAQKGIYISQESKKLTVDRIASKIFQYLLKQSEGATEATIIRELGLTRGVVRPRLKILASTEYSYGSKIYKVLCKNKKYSVLRKKKSTQGLEPSATSQQKEDFDDNFDYEVEALSNPDTLTSDEAIAVNKNTIFYEANPKKELDIKASIRELYNEDIYDIATGEKGVCIIFDKDIEDAKLESIKESVMKLYKESAKKRNLNYPNRKKK